MYNTILKFSLFLCPYLLLSFTSSYGVSVKLQKKTHLAFSMFSPVNLLS